MELINQGHTYLDPHMLHMIFLPKPTHEPLLLDSLVQIKSWKYLKMIFLENSFNMDKSVGL